eukprot:SAG11_NODE_482_length_9072_cov_12.361306_11_plen_87_part_00
MSEPRPIHTIPPPPKWWYLLCNAHVTLVIRVALENSIADDNTTAVHTSLKNARSCIFILTSTKQGTSMYSITLHEINARSAGPRYV